MKEKPRGPQAVRLPQRKFQLLDRFPLPPDLLPATLTRSPTPPRLSKYTRQPRHLAASFRSPGEGRPSHKIPAQDLLWSIVLGTLLRPGAFLALEALGGSTARRNLAVRQAFGDEALGYFTERLDPAPPRAALAAVLHRAKRHKAFEGCRFVGLALDGTTAGGRRKSQTPR